MNPTRKTLACHLVAALMLAATAATAQAATTPLQGRLIPRPLTPGDKTLYKLASTMEVSGGIDTVAVGTPVYLEADINILVPITNVTGVTWSVVAAPSASKAVLTASPLPATMPVYEPSDRLIYQVADRQMLRPDVTGQYTVQATIATANYGTTNVALTLTVGTYMGISACQACHSGNPSIPAMAPPWSTTAHAHIFTEGLDGLLGHYSLSCLACHTVGYNANTNAVNGGFDDVAKADGWVFPPVQTNGNWAAMPADLQNVANIQCENCHGPGSEHINAALRPPGTVTNWPRLEVTTLSGDCNQCHDAPTHHIKGTEWYNSMHAVTTRDPSGPGEEGCVICHTANGFIARISGGTTNTDYAAIGCQACHEPHGVTIPTNNVHLLRTLAPVTLMDGFTTITNAGNGQICMNCHMSRRNATNYVEVTAGSSRFGPHHGPQADMLMGANAVTYGKVIPSSAHRDVVGDACATCHMQTTATTDPAFLQAGGHTFNVSATVGGTNIDMVAACVQCHGAIASFDFPRQDYDGNGIVEGVQTEVKGLLNKLAYMLPPVGQPKSTISINSSWTRQQLRAGYNYLFVSEDKSFGVHNLAYAVGLLKASIADLSGDANTDGLPDWWQVQYYGSITNPAASPNYIGGSGVANWLAYALQINPSVPGQTLTNGIVYGNITAMGDTNLVHIYTAAEVTFDTQVGTTYYVQSISSLSGGWQNVSAAIPGTGAAISYLTPTRQNVQQYYRVMHTP